MKVYDSNDLRNIAILGHSGCGKTNLIEAIAYTANLTNKIPQLSDKTNMTYSMGLVPVEYNGIKYNLLDTPGYFDFCGEVISSLRACAAAVIVIDATNPIQVGTEKSLEFTENMPKIMFINKIDNEKARYKDAIDMLREKYDKKIVPMIIPEYKDKQFVKLHNILDNLQEAYDGDFEQQVLAIKEGLMELVAESDDAYLDKYFSGEEFTEEELQKGITIGIKRGDIIPVICGSTINNIGTKEILETLESYIYPGHIDSDAPFRGQVFKTMVDPFTGKMSYIKIIEGTLKKDMEVIDITQDKKEKIYVPLVAEIENLFLIPKVIELVAKKQNIENVDDLLEQTKAKTIEFLQEHLEEQSLLFAKKRCQNTINNICNQPTSTIEEYKASLDGVVDIVNPQEEYNKVREELQKIIDDKDYLAALKVINNKGLLPSTNLPNVFGWKKQYYIEYVIRLLESKDSVSEELCDIFREYVPVEI